MTRNAEVFVAVHYHRHDLRVAGRHARPLRAVVVLVATLAASLSACSRGREAKDITAPPGQVATDPLSSIVDSIRLAFNMPAMGAAIVTLEGGITALAVAGTRRATGGAAVSTDDLWHLGSNTKAGTSLLAAVAVSQNRIQWTTTVAQAFPELTNIRAEQRDVTLRDLLSHQSGFPRDASPLAFANATTAPAQRAAAVTWAVQQPPIVARGTYSYSNLGYVIASAMLERAFGTSYEAAMATHIHAPLGMTDAAWGPQAAAGSTTQPVAHVWDPKGSWVALEAFDNPPVYNSSGRAHMSLTSWGRLMREVLRVEAGASTIGPADVARQTTLAAVTVNPTTSYGMGWLISTRSWANGKVLYHDGSNGANHSLAFVAPMRNVAYLATTNGYDPAGRSSQALDALIARLNAFHTSGR
jgi:CubicO group peptidase (beta-lactamase class C family)